jgi:large subunit ribosomal protein L10
MSMLLAGPTAVIWSKDSPSAPAKVAVKWAAEQEKFQIKGGFFDGTVLDANGVKALATMPGKDELRSMLLMTFIAAPTEFVKLLAAGPQNFAYLLDARKRQLEAAG